MQSRIADRRRSSSLGVFRRVNSLAVKEQHFTLRMLRSSSDFVVLLDIVRSDVVMQKPIGTYEVF